MCMDACTLYSMFVCKCHIFLCAFKTYFPSWHLWLLDDLELTGSMPAIICHLEMNRIEFNSNQSHRVFSCRNHSKYMTLKYLLQHASIALKFCFFCFFFVVVCFTRYGDTFEKIWKDSLLKLVWTTIKWIEMDNVPNAYPQWTWSVTWSH